MDYRLSEEWILTGLGQITKTDGDVINFNSGNTGRDITQSGCSNFEWINFLSVLDKQNEVIAKTLEQSGQMINSINRTIDEISAQRKQVDKLIGIIERRDIENE